MRCPSARQRGVMPLCDLEADVVLLVCVCVSSTHSLFRGDWPTKRQMRYRLCVCEQRSDIVCGDWPTKRQMRELGLHTEKSVTSDSPTVYGCMSSCICFEECNIRFSNGECVCVCVCIVSFIRFEEWYGDCNTSRYYEVCVWWLLLLDLVE